MQARLQSDFIPATQAELPRLLIMLHGLGDSMEGYRWLPYELRLPWLSYLLVNAPDPYYDGFAWYDFSGQMAEGIERSRKLLEKLIDDQKARGFEPESIALAGFSQGSLIAVETGLRLRRRLAGIVGLSGHISDPDRLVAEIPESAFEQRLLITHGTLDTLLPFAVVREQINALKAAGLHIEWHELAKGHTIEGEFELELIRDFLRRCFDQPGNPPF